MWEGHTMISKRKEKTKLSVLFALFLVFTVGCDMIDDLAGSSDDSGASSGTQSAKPNLLGATAPSNHYVDVQFSAPVGDQEAMAENYTITGPDGTPLPVEAAHLSDDQTKVTLTTGPQEPVEYKLTLVPTLAIANFGGSTVGEEFLVSAVSLSNTEVMLLFSAKLGARAD
jgi:hypothetical protein